MKLKNSHILLIVMAIFLLISIGSVCANENITTDKVNLADDGTDVVLANESATQKIDTEIVSNDVKISDKETKKIDVTVNNNESEPIKISKENITVTENNAKLNFTYSNNSITLSDKLTNGNHSLLITYLGNAVYNNSTKNIILSIFGNYAVDMPNSVNVNSTKIVKVPVKVTNGVDLKTATSDDFIVTLTYKEGNDTKTVGISKIEYTNNNLVFLYNLTDTITTSNMTITYKNGTEEEITGKTKLNRIYNAKIEILNTENEYKDGNFTFKLVDVDKNAPLVGKTLSLNVITTSTVRFSATTDSNGIATFKNGNMYYYGNGTLKELCVGKHYIELTTSSPIVSTKVATNLTIKKTTYNIQIDSLNEDYGTTKNATITVVNSKTKNPVSGLPVYFKMTDSNGNEVAYSSKNSNNTTVKINTIPTNSNGCIELPISSLKPGTYSIYASLNDTSDYSKTALTKTITIKPIPVTYTISGTGTITVKNKATGKAVAGAYVLVKFDNNNNKMFLAQTNSNGIIKITTVGKHKITVSDGDSIYTGKSVTKTITAKKITAKVSAPKVTAYYKGDGTFTVKLTNSNKDPIYDAKLNIKVYFPSKKYSTYKGNTGIDGQIRLSLDGLNPGTYKVEITSGDTKSFNLKKATSKIVVKKAPTKLTPTKVTAKKGASKYFKVTAKNTKTNKAISGVKVKIKVYTGKKYKTYTVKTNSKGIAKLNVKSLAVGSHKVVVSSGDKYCDAKTAKSTIKITKK